MASQTASCPPSQLVEGNCEATSCCLLGTYRTWDSNGDSVDSHQGTSIRFCRLWEVTLADKQSGQLSIFEMPLLPAFIIPCSCLDPRLLVGGSVFSSQLNKGTRICCFSPSWSTGDGEPGTICPLCPVPLCLKHTCWAPFYWQDWPVSTV